MTHVRRSHKKKGHHEEEHENHERWLVSYADMVTLLMCLFIVLFAISQVDIKKFGALSEGLQDGFGAPMSILEDGNAAPEEPGLTVAAPAPVNLKGDAGISGQGLTDVQKAAEAAVQAEQLERTQREAENAYDELAAARDKIDAALRNAGYPDSAIYRIDERGLVVSIIADQVLFDAAEAKLRPEGRTILTAVAPTLRDLPNKLSVDGHTNNIPTDPNGPWPSNWELSAYRATTVLRYLAEQNQVPQQRMTATGFADTVPLVDPSDPTALTVNRRVDIVVLSTASAAANAQLPALDAVHHQAN